jgi:8-oxo-dGTP pyrophosphatase MutT (NUDIX family)
VFLNSLRAKTFWVISRCMVAAYRLFPIFGPIRGTAAIIQRDEKYVVIERNDGYGLCFPGGMAKPWERNEEAIRREVEEETGLNVDRAEFVFNYRIDVLYPTVTNVFKATAQGELRDSWEGSVRLATIAELESAIMPTQRAVVEYLKSGKLP